jgi:nucleoside-diphosphate-sugar epimerase
MNNKDVPVLVTGASGLVGSYLLTYLVQLGYTNIRALHRKDSDLKLLAPIKDKIRWIEGDIRHYFDVEGAMEAQMQVYHCAAMVSYDDRDYHRLMQVNVGGTENVVNAALNKGISKLVHVSSISAIGKNKFGKPINENSKWSQQSGNSTYAISKYLSEQVVWRGWAEGLNVAIVNPSIIIGAGDWHRSSPALFRQIEEGLKFYPVGSTGFVDVRDVVQFMQQLMESDVSAERFILSAENLLYRTFFNAIAKHLDKPAPSIAVNPFLREVAWRLEWLRSRLSGKRVLITRETARLSAQQQSFDNSKSKSIDRFQYRKIEDSIAETAALLKNSGEGYRETSLLPFD